MDARTIGMTARVDDVDIGKCIIFNVNLTAQIGIVVSLNQLEKGILHLDAMKDGVAVPTIYEMHHFYNEKCIVIDSARIVPVLAPEHVGFGRFSRPASQALYITDEGVLISALKGNSILPINLLKGKPDYMDSFNSVYTRAWYIEVVDVDGSYEPYHEFRCEPSP